MGRVCQGPSLSWAEFVMDRDVPESGQNYRHEKLLVHRRFPPTRTVTEADPLKALLNAQQSASQGELIFDKYMPYMYDVGYILFLKSCQFLKTF